jgi:hypothetical protein
VYQGPRGSCLMKKTRGRKSRVRVPLMSVFLLPILLPVLAYLSFLDYQNMPTYLGTLYRPTLLYLPVLLYCTYCTYGYLDSCLPSFCLPCCSCQPTIPAILIPRVTILLSNYLYAYLSGYLFQCSYRYLCVCFIR